MLPMSSKTINSFFLFFFLIIRVMQTFKFRGTFSTNNLYDFIFILWNKYSINLLSIIFYLYIFLYNLIFNIRYVLLFWSESFFSLTGCLFDVNMLKVYLLGLNFSNKYQLTGFRPVMNAPSWLKLNRINHCFTMKHNLK